MNDATATKETGFGCPPACGMPGASAPPSLKSWTVTYACVPAE
jgi:hypothetical protein